MSGKTLEELVRDASRCTSIKELYAKFKYEYLLIDKLVEKREQLRRKSSEELDRKLRAIDFQTMADR